MKVFSCGEIDGNFGKNLQKALSVYQADRRLPESGKLDAATWAALNADTAPALMAYSVTGDDVKGPFTRIPPEMAEKAELPALVYSSPLEALAEKFHSLSNPVLGEHPSLSGLIFASGFSGHGLMMSPATGKIVSEIVRLGRSTTFDISIVAPDRFGRGARVHEAATI